jgi:Bacterial Ig domain
VRASSVDGSIIDQVYSINIIDMDEFDVTVPTDVDGTVNMVAENRAIGTLVGLVANATDADATNYTITYSLDDSSGGRFSIDPVTGVVRTAALLDFELSTSHRITVRATGSDGSTTTADFFVDVVDGNEMPTALGESYTTTYAETITTSAPGLLANDSDPEGNPLTVILVNGPSNGTLTMYADGSFTYKPTIAFIGQVFFDYYVTDGSLQSGLATAVINVTQAIAPPPSDSGGGGSNSGQSTNENSSGSSISSSSTNTDTSGSPTSNTDNDPVEATGGAIVGPLMENTSIRSSSGDSVQSASEKASGDVAEAAGSSSGPGVGLIDVHYSGMAHANIESLLAWGNSSSSSHSAIGRLMAEAEAREIVGLAKMIHTYVSNENTSQFETSLKPSTSVEIATKTAIGSGVVIWVARIGQFAAAVLAASSAWRHLDPLSILNATNASESFDEADKLFENSKSINR